MPLVDRQRQMDWRFPLKGLNVATGFNQPPPGTTQVGVNVRAFDAGTNRMRGGTRPGLSPFFGAGSTEQVSGFHPIQHLACVVYVSASAVG